MMMSSLYLTSILNIIFNRQNQSSGRHQPVPRLFLEGVRILFGKEFGGCLGPQSGPGRSPVRGPGDDPPGSRREIGKMRVKIQSPRLHFPVSFLCKNCSKFTKIIHKSCTLKQHDWSFVRNAEICNLLCQIYIFNWGVCRWISVKHTTDHDL